MKLLIVTPYFVPQSSVAVVRIASLIRYLIEKENDITVLTNKIEYSEDDSTELVKFKSINRIEVDISKNNGKYFKDRDSYIEAFKQEMSKNVYDAVIITTGPFYTLPLCSIARRDYNTLCFVDFRDLWVLDIRELSTFIRPRNLLKKMVFSFIERQAIKDATAITTVTNGWADILRKIYPKYKDKVEVIFNGYDDDSLKKSEGEETKLKNIYINENNFNIMSFGKLSYYSKKYSATLFQALKLFHEKHKNFKLIQVGLPESQTENLISRLKIKTEWFMNTGFSNYKNGMDILKRANVFVVIDIRKHAIGTKIYDYIYINKPVIYIGKKNTYLSNFVDSFENGYSCQNKEQIIEALAYIKKNNIKTLSSNFDKIKYSRRTQNKKFLELINRYR